MSRFYQHEKKRFFVTVLFCYIYVCVYYPDSRTCLILVEVKGDVKPYD